MGQKLASFGELNSFWLNNCKQNITSLSLLVGTTVAFDGDLIKANKNTCSLKRWLHTVHVQLNDFDGVFFSPYIIFAIFFNTVVLAVFIDGPMY